MTGRLIRARIQRKRNEAQAAIRWRVDVGTTEVIRQISVVELRREGQIQADTMGGNLKSIQRAGINGRGNLETLKRNLERLSRGVNGRGQRRRRKSDSRS